MNFLRLSWWCTPLISYNWVRARDLATRGKYRKALRKLSSIRRMRGPNIRPLGQWTTEYYLTEGHCHYRLDQKNKARASLEAALAALKKADIYDLREQDYIRAYIQTTHPELELINIDSIDINGIDLDNIEPDLRNYYPLTAHPEWDRD